MASTPRIVAELGRPETPQETADRKAASSAAYRSSQTFRSLIAALIVTVAVVAVVYLGVPRGSLAEPEPVDVAATAAEVSASLDHPILVPVVPADWRANSARVEGQMWRAVYAPASGYVRIAQAFDAPDGWVQTELGGYAPTGSVTISGIEWDEYRIPSAGRTDSVSYALATDAGTDVVLVYGDTDADTAAIAAGGVADQIRALREGDTVTEQAAPARETPAAVWEDMRAGNARFVAGEPNHPNQDVERRHLLAAAQTPRAALFGCADSRLAAEIIFDQGLGDLFVVRNAGQVASDSAVASLEYAVAALDVPLIIVLAHDACGAVRAAIDSTTLDSPELPSGIWQLIAKIVPAARTVLRESEGVDPRELDAEDVGIAHLRNTIDDILGSSRLIADAVAAGRLGIVGANYRLSEGTAVPHVTVGIAD